MAIRNTLAKLATYNVHGLSLNVSPSAKLHEMQEPRRSGTNRDVDEARTRFFLSRDTYISHYG